MIAAIHIELAVPGLPAHVQVDRHAPNWYGVLIGEHGVQVLGDPEALLRTFEDVIDQIRGLHDDEPARDADKHTPDGDDE